MSFVDDIKEYVSEFESLVYCSVRGNSLFINDEVCYTHLPLGNMMESYYIDKKYKEVNMIDYIIKVDYYLYYKPLSYSIFQRMFNLNKEVIEILKNNKINIYQVDIIYERLLKNNGGYKQITTNECYKMTRHNPFKVKLETPPDLFKDYVVLITNSYYFESVFILSEW